MWVPQQTCLASFNFALHTTMLRFFINSMVVAGGTTLAVATFPVLFCQRNFIQGITAGAMKVN